MQVFVSYARVHEAVAEEVSLALRAEGHGVFFDRTSLPAGEGFHRLIREHLEAADKLVFLVSPASVGFGSYALTELRLAQEKWPNPDGRVLSVIVEATPLDAMPAYLRANTVLQPVGNVAAEVAAELGRRAKADPTRPSTSVRAHLACFVTEPDRPALFINVVNLSFEREVEVTHVWLEAASRAHALQQQRPLPVRLRPSESWETWVFLADVPALPANELCQMARVRLSTGEVMHSTENLDVPEVGYVPGGDRS